MLNQVLKVKEYLSVFISMVDIVLMLRIKLIYLMISFLISFLVVLNMEYLQIGLTMKFSIQSFLQTGLKASCLTSILTRPVDQIQFMGSCLSIVLIVYVTLSHYFSLYHTTLDIFPGSGNQVMLFLCTRRGQKTMSKTTALSH